ncbi:MAG: PKD domain-containing protein [Candidatus Geothermincolia bacterium]
MRFAGRLDIGDILRIAEQIAGSLATLHEADLVHLFLNGDNVLYAPKGEVFLKDAALAPAFFSACLEHLHSYDYSFLAPELMDGSLPGVASDVFSYGWLLRRMLEMRTEEAESGVRRQLEGIADLCASPVPEERYSTVRDIMALLTEMRTGDPVSIEIESAQDEPILDDPNESSFFCIANYEDEEAHSAPRDDFEAFARRRAGPPRRGRLLPRLALVLASLALAVLILLSAYANPGKGAREIALEQDDSAAIDGAHTEIADEAELEPERTEQEVQVTPETTPAANSEPATREEAPAFIFVEDTSLTSPAEPQRPVATFVMSPTSGTSPLRVSLDASGSHDPDGAIASYSWSFGGGSVRCHHVFEASIFPASIPVTLTVVDCDGLSASSTQYVTLY